MSNFSGINPPPAQRIGGPRYLVHWKARLFMSDKVIHPATVIGIFEKGFVLRFFRATPLNTEMNIEFMVNFREEMHRIRIKGQVKYCLLRSQGDGADIDIATTKISREDNHTLNNILQILQESKEFNLRQP